MAAQEAQRASFYVERAKQHRQEKIVQAEGEAQAAKLASTFVLFKENIAYYANFDRILIFIIVI